MRSGFTIPETLREAAGNLRASPARTAALIIATLLMSAAATATAAADTAAQEADFDKQVAAGSTTWTLTSGNGTPLPVPRCDALNTVTGIHAAGAIMAATDIYPVTAPTTRITLLTVSPGYLAAAFPNVSPDTTVLAGTGAATRLGLGDGATLDYRTTTDATAPTTTLTVAQAATERGRIDGINDAILIASPATGTSDGCLAAVDPGAWTVSALVVQGWFAAAHRPLAAPLVLPNDLVADPDRGLRARPSRYVGIAAGLAILVMLTAAWLSRRNEYALYRMLGLTRLRLVAMLTVDTIALGVIPLQAAAGLVALAYATHADPVVAAVLSECFKAVSITAITPLIGVAILGPIDVRDSLKGK